MSTIHSDFPLGIIRGRGTFVVLYNTPYNGVIRKALLYRDAFTRVRRISLVAVSERVEKESLCIETKHTTKGYLLTSVWQHFVTFPS